ncbi:TPA: glucose-6-phosphate dehydrogenase [bacterium]|nr:glucose-6-phosphate dehydrogenase [bacterium]
MQINDNIIDDDFDVRGGFCTELRPDPCGIIIFGASGDLTFRKLIPSLFSLYKRELMPKNFYVLGCARTDMTDEEFRNKSLASIIKKSSDIDQNKQNDFINRFTYISGDYSDSETYLRLSKRLEELDNLYLTEANHLFYLAITPDLYCKIVNMLGSVGLITESRDDKRCVHVVFEKPFGRDLESALSLDRELHHVLTEDQIYRIDHYLGKETVQNILMFRFANAIFEPIWNHNYIDHVQITVAETIGVEHRAGYFERAGLLRDMFQNHILQMLALVAMEPPISFNSDRVRDERVKLLRALRRIPLDKLNDYIIRGQYMSGIIDGENVPSYRDEKNVAKDSSIETFVSAKLFIGNWRWQGVPFYVRTGKRLAQKVSEIVIVFKRVPYSMFSPLPPESLSPNVLVLNVQPEEGMALTIQAKQPGAKLCMNSLTLDFRYKDVFGAEMPDAYERLLLDCMLGDQTLFWRSDDVEATWAFVTPILDKWELDPECCPLTFYKSGSWGPDEAKELIKRDGREWRIN